MNYKLLKFFNKSRVKIILFWILFWIIQSLLMSGGTALDGYLIKNIAIVGLQIFVVYFNLKILFPYFFEKKRYGLYIIIAAILIYAVYTVSFFAIRFVFSFQNVKVIGNFGFPVDFWRILSGSSFYSLALVCSTVYKLIGINKKIENENHKIKKENATETICIKEANKSHFVLIQDIYFIKGLREYVVWHTIDKKIISLESLKGIESKLQEKGFVRIHKSYIINIKKILSTTSTSVTINDEIIPVGRKYKENFSALLKEIQQ